MKAFLSYIGFALFWEDNYVGIGGKLCFFDVGVWTVAPSRCKAK